MVVVAQLVRASDCGSEGRRFEPGLPPKTKKDFLLEESFFIFLLAKTRKNTYLCQNLTLKKSESLKRVEHCLPAKSNS